MQLMSTAWIWMSGGDLRHPRVRHAGDTPLEGFAWRKSPIAEWRSVTLRVNEPGQPRAVAGLPGQRSCAVCDCTGSDVTSAFAAENREAAAAQQNQTVSMTTARMILLVIGALVVGQR